MFGGLHSLPNSLYCQDCQPHLQHEFTSSCLLWTRAQNPTGYPPDIWRITGFGLEVVIGIIWYLLLLCEPKWRTSGGYLVGFWRLYLIRTYIFVEQKSEYSLSDISLVSEVSSLTPCTYYNCFAEVTILYIHEIVTQIDGQ